MHIFWVNREQKEEVLTHESKEIKTRRNIAGQVSPSHFSMLEAEGQRVDPYLLQGSNHRWSSNLEFFTLFQSFAPHLPPPPRLVRICPWSCWVFLLLTTQSSSILFSNHRLNLIMVFSFVLRWGLGQWKESRLQTSQFHSSHPNPNCQLLNPGHILTSWFSLSLHLEYGDGHPTVLKGYRGN